jgi:asparaginyl-tRNA synthetase
LIIQQISKRLHAFEIQNGKTVRAMDILSLELEKSLESPERFDVLVEKMKALGIDEEELWWYLDTRRFGSAVLWFWT